MPAKTPLQTTILLLSSEPVMRQVLRETLDGAGYTVIATGDLGVAVDRLKECKPDLLLIHPYVDMMPGHDAARYLQARCPDMRILMMAGLLEDDRLRYRAEIEHFEVFPKPVAAAELLTKVKQVLGSPADKAG